MQPLGTLRSKIHSLVALLPKNQNPTLRTLLEPVDEPVKDDVYEHHEGESDDEEMLENRDEWVKRPKSWNRLLTLDRDLRLFDQSYMETAQGAGDSITSWNSSAFSTSSVRSSSRAIVSSSTPSTRPGTGTPSCKGNAKVGALPPAWNPKVAAPPTSRGSSRSFRRSRRRLRPVQPPPPGWSLRYCELVGVAADASWAHDRRRGALRNVEHKDLLTKFEKEWTEEASVFLTNKFATDARLSRFQDMEIPPSRRTHRRHAIVGHKDRLQASVAVKRMCLTNPGQVQFLLSVCESDEMKVVAETTESKSKDLGRDEIQKIAFKVGMTESEVQGLFISFKHYDFDSSFNLGNNEIRSILADLGMVPKNRNEKNEVNECINEMRERLKHEAFGFEEFLELLKAVRERLRAIQSISFMHMFLEADVDGSESLDYNEVVGIMENKLVTAPRSQDEHFEVRAIFSQCDADSDGLLNFEEFQIFMQKASAKLLTLRRKEEMAIAKTFQLGENILKECRAELPTFWEIFKRYTKDVEKGVARNDLVALMVDTGIAPVDATVDLFKTVEFAITKWAKQWNTFPSVLHMVFEARRRCKEDMADELAAKFNTYDRDKSGELSMQEVYQILSEFNMLPKTKLEQRELGRVIEQLDADGSGTFELEEFHSLWQKMSEHVRLSKRQLEHQAGLDQGISPERLAILRRNFMDCVPSKGGVVPQITLLQNMSKVRQSLSIVDMDEEDLKAHTRQVQACPDSRIDYKTFVDVVKHVLLDNETKEVVEDDDNEIPPGSQSRTGRQLKTQRQRGESG
eukprot:TRINITY_DN28715_c0_g1_i1.p1 TRINITY_DN28715_c0_g1~~TRINITY_DN28715_c0_g1_i1.p1  ORF type:complete len:797 (-),score=149.93 TRINITY_DN28715_c0_g1_i1:55-2445(-)